MEAPKTGFDAYVLEKVRKVVRDCQLQQVYFVGGTCRDWQLKMSAHDFDIVCLKNDIDVLAEGIRWEFKSTKSEAEKGQVSLVFREYLEIIRIAEGMSKGTELHRIILGKVGVSGPEAIQGVRIDIRKLVGGSIKEDAKTCDFTVNAVYFDIKKNVIIDPVDVS